MIVNSGFGFKRFTYSAPEEFGATYQTITINKTYVPSTQTNYVARIPASLFSSDFFTKLAIGGSPRFTLSDGSTKLASEKVYLDVSGSKGYYNVLVPTVNGTGEGSSTSIRVYYENSLDDLPPHYSYGRNAVWANNYKCVQNLHTTPDLTQVNSTGNSNYDMTQIGSLVSTDIVTAAYGGGNAHFYDGTGEGVRVDYNDVTSYPFSIGLLFRTPTDAQDQGKIAGIYDSSIQGEMFGLNKIGLKETRSLMAQSGPVTNSPSYPNMGSTSWNFAVAVFASTTSRTIYFNNVTPVSNTDTQALNAGLSGVGIGSFNYATDQHFSGDLAVQDFFITAEELSADKITTMYNNYFNGSFFTIT